MKPSLTRRHFLQTSGAGLATLLLPAVLPAAGMPRQASWPIGCFNRPWMQSPIDVALDAIKAAGYEWTGLLAATKTEPFIAAAASPDYLAALKQKIARRGLKANMGALRIRYELDDAALLADTRQQIANAHTLGLQYALTFGVDKPEHYGPYFKAMRVAAAAGQELGVKVVLKPHGGGSGASEEILRSMKEVGHANFKVWYDAGNIIYYTGKDPVTELEPIAQHVTGFCAKDCTGPKGEVMIQFGAGKVDFVRVFQKLKSAGFNGPIMVECCKIADTPEGTLANARANRLFLEKTLAQV